MGHCRAWGRASANRTPSARRKNRNRKRGGVEGELEEAATVGRKRCEWAAGDPVLVHYHDHQWGVPLHDDRLLFECLMLQGVQAGLSWLTVLKRRDKYRKAFARFDPGAVASFGSAKIKELLHDPGIVKNESKIRAAVANARSFLQVEREFGSFDTFIWSFVGGTPIGHGWKRCRDIPATSAEARAMSRELKRRGFRFVGPVTCYAFMQATGMVNDHTTDCFRYRQLGKKRSLR